MSIKRSFEIESIQGNEETEIKQYFNPYNTLNGIRYSLAQFTLQPGIYGYHIYGTINYFGVATVPIDSTIFCASSQGPTTKFNSPGWSGSFGCTEDIAKIKFP